MSFLPQRTTLVGLLVAGLAGVTTGCGTTLSTLQPAEPMKPGHVQAQGAFNVNVPASRVIDAVDTSATLAAKYASDSGYRPSEDEQRRALGSAVGLGLSSPGVNPDIMLRIGVIENLDVGLRWSGIAAHGDVKYRFLRTRDPAPKAAGPGTQGEPAKPSGMSRLGNGPEDPGFQGAISLGVSKSLYSGFVFDTLDTFEIGDYSRWNVEVPVIFGSRLGQFGHVWFGPKYVYSRYAVDMSLKNVGIVRDSGGSIHHFGGFGGVGLGYKVVFLFTELTVMKMVAEPEILGQKVDLGGLVVVPSVGLMLRL